MGYKGQLGMLAIQSYDRSIMGKSLQCMGSCEDLQIFTIFDTLKYGIE